MQTEEQIAETLTGRLVGRTGMVSLRSRFPEVLAAAREHLKESGLAGWDEYLQALDGESFLLALAGRLTIGETYFFRHPEVFEALRTRIFPEFLQSGRPVRMWSAACSNGCEPYSLSIAWLDFLEESGRRADDLSVEIMGTDLNQNYLEQARRAVYGKWSLRNLPEEWVEARFRQVSSGQHELIGRYRMPVRFRRMNLLEPADWSGCVPGSLDLIFCRNVMIYFDAETIRNLAIRFFDLLRTGGWLVVGASECNTEWFGKFDAVDSGGAILYRKPQFSTVLEKRSGGVYSPLDFSNLQPGGRSSAPAKIPVKPPVRSVAIGSGDVPGAVCAGTFAEQKNWAGLRELCDRWIVLEELNPDAHFYKGLALHASDSPDDAERSYRRALFLNRRHPAALCNLALLLAGRPGRSDAAKKALAIALRELESAEAPGESGIFLCSADLLPISKCVGILRRQAESLP